MVDIEVPGTHSEYGNNEQRILKIRIFLIMYKGACIYGAPPHSTCDIAAFTGTYVMLPIVHLVWMT